MVNGYPVNSEAKRVTAEAAKGGLVWPKEVQILSSRLSTVYCHLELKQIHSTTPLFSPAPAGARLAPLFPTYIQHMYRQYKCFL